jgi:exoribonuclease-2
MSQGKIIEYIEQGKFVCSVCIQDKGTRLHLLTPLNRQVNLPPKRAIFSSTAGINLESPREEMLNKLKNVELLRDSLKEEVNVKELWELIKDEHESYDYKYLAQLSFGNAVTDDHVSALVRALFYDRLYFKMKDGRFEPNSEEKVEKIIRQREEEALREESLEKGSKWLKNVLQDNKEPAIEDNRDTVNVLVELALYGKEAPDFKYGKELLSRVGVTDINEARNILVRIGVWERDENLDILRLGIRESFTDDQIKEANRINKTAINMERREDLRDLDVLTIDGPLTMDFDDALSIDFKDNHIQLGIHIADVASLIDAETPLDMEAMIRGSSLYLARHQIPMFPPDLSHDRLSLVQDSDRQALSLLVGFDESGNMVDYRFAPSIIKVKEQLTYDQVNDIFNTAEGIKFQKVYRLCEKLRLKRIEQGALILSVPELDIRVDDNSSIDIKLVPQDSPSRMIVAELMILYNWLAARFCGDNNVPIYYRGQKEPSEKLSIDENGYIYYVFRQRRKLYPLIVNMEPAPHSGLGLEVYSNLTSPIRRYFDLVSQRQMLNYIFSGTLLYNKEELDKIRLQVQTSLKDLNTVRRKRVIYWIQRHLQKHIGRELPAIVLDVMKSKYRIILTDFLIMVEMKSETGSKLAPGESITVKVVKSDPINDILKLEYTGKKKGDS